jgi:hypothetical protein
MKYYLLFLIVILLSCSKKEGIVDLNNTFENEIITELTDTLNYESLDNLNIISIDSSQQNAYKAILQDFYEHPFMDENIILPDYYGYTSFEELFNALGIPIDEFSTTIQGSLLEGGNYVRGFEFEYYNIGTLYVVSKDVIYIYFVWINMKDEILYNHNIKKNDTPDKITNLLGDRYQISKQDENVIEYTYYLDWGVPQINFQFINEKLTSIIFHLMP